jgi:MFS superfamily sulfate permease-like transporter
MGRPSDPLDALVGLVDHLGQGRRGLTLLAGLLADLPLAVLGAIVLVAAVGLVQLAPLRRILTIRRRDFWLGLVALAGVLAFGVLRGVLGAVLVSLLALLHELDHPPIVAGERAPGLLVVRPEGGCSSPTPAACSTVSPPSSPSSDLRRGWCCWTSAPSTTWEITALERLADLAEDLHGQGEALWVAAPSQRPLAMLRRAAELLGCADLQADTGRLGFRFFMSLDDALTAYREHAQPGHPWA